MSIISDRIEPGAQDYFNYIASFLNINYQLNSVMELAGRIDENILEKSIRLMINENQVLGCRLILDENKLYWEKRSDLENIELCSLIQTNHEAAEVLSFVNRPLNEGVDPLFLVCIFRGETHDTLCFKISHAVADGRGTKDFLERLNVIYNQLAANPDYSVHPNSGTRSQMEMLHSITDESLINARSGVSNTNGKPCSYPYTSEESYKGQSSLAVQYLLQEEFSQVRLQGKKYDATVNDLLITALFRALWRVNPLVPREKSVLGCTVDLRQYLPQKRMDSICNLSSLFTIQSAQNLSESFGETLKQVITETKQLKQNVIGPDFPIMLEAYTRLGFKETLQYIIQSEDGPPGFVFSNLGVIGKGVIYWQNIAVNQLYITGPALNPPSSLFVATTYNNVLSLTFTFASQAASEKNADAFLRLVLAEMRSFMNEE